MADNLHGLNLGHEEIEELIKNHFPHDSVLSFNRMNRGIMNWVVEVKLESGKELILKVSNQEKKFGIEKEKFCFDLVKDKVPVPEVYGFDFSMRKYPYEYLIVEKIQGYVLEDIWGELTENEKEEIVYETGEYLAKMHEIKFEKFGGIHGINVFKDYSSFVESSIDGAKEILELHRKEKFLPEEFIKKVEKYFKKTEKLLETKTTPRFVHFDYHFWHIIVDKENSKWKINGILDFGFASKSIGESDFVKAERWIFPRGKNIKKSFLEGYESVLPLPKNYQDFVNIQRVMMDFWFIYRLYKTNQIELAKEYKKIVDQIIDEHKINP